MTATDNRPRLRDLLLGVVLAGASGAAIVAHTFGPVELRYSAPFIVLPSAAVLVGVIFAARRRYDRVRILGDRLLYGAAWGLAATIVYDLVRPAMVAILSLDTDPYAAMPLFGSLITLEPTESTTAQVLGWIYHFWNGIGFGMMFALVRPRGAFLAGLAWGLILEGIMLFVYPGFIGADIADAAFVSVGVVGHAAWGLALGAGLKRWGPSV